MIVKKAKMNKNNNMCSIGREIRENRTPYVNIIKAECHCEPKIT